jgi:methylase of polypeptide subunit release factors
MQSFTTLQKRCSLAEVMIEMDRILRPEGTVIIRDSPGMVARVVKVAKAIRWSFEISEAEPGAPGKEQIFVARKEFWKVDNIATQ